jgi:hypothetical protein
VLIIRFLRFHYLMVVEEELVFNLDFIYFQNG